ncbi:DUF4232 domain-containing protein [Actinomadura algeriensis]|uniref:DUF4232 domain-containing protein n=1 Tax=Actinomadura algeriensis TaxID=1679523 RepID=A0ABR9JMP1_9ACTN|nr:DUF4232 domain-containing protein [Actinomadura algeriensis]MBE1531805.1 hypothetical protein [Actinomadura algeriensis]
MSLFSRTAVLAAVLVLSAACGTEVHSSPAADGGAAVPSPTASGAPSPIPPLRTPELARTECSPDGVRLEALEPDAAMGLRGMRVKLVNCGDEPYRVNGYPALRVLGESGKPFEVRIVKGSATVPDPGPKAIAVRPGASASAVVTWRNTVTYGTNVNGVFLEVTPGTGRNPLNLRVPGGLDLGTTGRLEVTAWSLP